MYLKLALRNAKRSAFDYMLYIATMTILTAIMCVSNCISVFGNQYGFETAALPMLIVLIMIALVNYINTFMMKQRAKEFASYLLLGMEKSKLLQMFLLEYFFIGVVCFFLGALLGIGIYLAVFSRLFQAVGIGLLPMIKSILLTLLFFAIVELFSAFRIRQKIYKLQITVLMQEKRRNQTLQGNRKTFWGLLFVLSSFVLLLLLCGIVFLPEEIISLIISFIGMPTVFINIIAFYKWIYVFFSFKRLLLSDYLYKGNRLYRIADMTKGTKTSALMDAIFCICFVLSVMTFVFGILMLNENIEFYPSVDLQQLMGFIQISLCIIFMTIYFSILALQQIIELKQQAINYRILHYMGKSHAQIMSLIKSQVMLKLLVPILMGLVLLLFGAPIINYKINTVLPVSLHNSMIKAVGAFIVCFAILYFCYFLIVYFISKRYIKTTV
ncbi:MAG: FtsX-like permease family protein [Lachnospiraceae bacterium]